MITELPTHNLPVLYGLDSKGKVKVWRAWAYEDTDGTAGFKTLHGLKGGKLQEQGKIIKEGKNLGRSNSTTPYEQAIAEVTSKWTKKRDLEGYGEDETSLSVPRLPMLAKNYKDASHKIVFPCYLQEKMDGIRCHATKINGDTIRYTSRKGLPITTIEHLTPALLDILEIDEVLDGEIYCDSLTFQQITAATKKERPDSLKLELHVYDMADSEKDFYQRYERYKSMPDRPGIVKVESYLANSEDDINKSHEIFVERGKEGLIARNRLGGYEFKKRSNNLMKLKSFDDAEYKVVGGYEGSGSAEGHATLICVTDTGQEFGCTMKGSHGYRASLWNNLDKIVAANTYVTVKYFGLTDAGLPRFPVGLRFRKGAINKNGVFEPNL